jgi:hypothetical protein
MWFYFSTPPRQEMTGDLPFGLIFNIAEEPDGKETQKHGR